jgi:methylase of polypeptide subunit release factors
MIANLPYVPAREDYTIGSVPRATIQGSGDDGLGLVRQLARDATQFLSSGGLLQLQMLGWQWDLLAPELVTLGYRPGPPQVFGSFAICAADLAVPAADAH